MQSVTRAMFLAFAVMAGRHPAHCRFELDIGGVARTLPAFILVAVASLMEVTPIASSGQRGKFRPCLSFREVLENLETMSEHYLGQLSVRVSVQLRVLAINRVDSLQRNRGRPVFEIKEACR